MGYEMCCQTIANHIIENNGYNADLGQLRIPPMLIQDIVLFYQEKTKLNGLLMLISESLRKNKLLCSRLKELDRALYSCQSNSYRISENQLLNEAYHQFLESCCYYVESIRVSASEINYFNELDAK